MDKINRNILHILQSEGRISFSELAKRVHLSAPAVAERVKRLEEESVITGYTATIDSHNMGLPITAMVQARVFIGKEPQILAFMKQWFPGLWVGLVRVSLLMENFAVFVSTGATAVVSTIERDVEEDFVNDERVNAFHP